MPLRGTRSCQQSPSSRQARLITADPVHESKSLCIETRSTRENVAFPYQLEHKTFRKSGRLFVKT